MTSSNETRNVNPQWFDLPEVPAKPFFTRQEAVELVGVPERLLRQWEREFAVGHPRGRTRRFFRRSEILLLRRIRRLLLGEGRSHDEVRQLLGLSALADEAVSEQLASWCGALAEVEHALAAVVRYLNAVLEKTPTQQP
nr:MerR family transcriptional regulator [Hydrogenophilus thiooxidans]